MSNCGDCWPFSLLLLTGGKDSRVVSKDDSDTDLDKLSLTNCDFTRAA